MTNAGPQKILSKADADTRVVEYTPREFPNRMSEAAVEFVRFQSTQENPEFKIDRIVSMTTGISDLEKISLSERVETEALERLKSMQEEAYRQGYDLGRDEGQESAYQEKMEELSQRLKQIDNVVHVLETLKTELVKQNEASIVTLIYQVAAKIAMAEIKEKPELVLPVIQQAAAGSQSEEQITIRLSAEDLDFIENMKSRLGQEFEFMKQAKLEASEEINQGGCVIVTNFGQVDATIEKRLEKVWTSIEQKLPKKTDILSESSSDDGNQT